MSDDAHAAVSRPASGSSKLEDLLNAPTDVYTGTTISYGQMAWARARVVARAPIAKDRPSHGTLITASFDGSYVAVVWPAARQYAVYAPGASGAAPWDEISTGFGSSVAWHAAKNMFAVVEDLQAPTAPAPGPLKDAKKGFGSMMRKEKEKDGADAVDASRAPSFGSSLVKIWMASGRSVTVLHHGLHMHVTDRPVAVVSGPLLAVSLRKTCDGCDLVAGRDGAGTMQLFGWEDAGKAGPELPEPLLMSWDQSLNFAALAYSSQPAFKAVASLPVAGVVGMAWAARQLYLLTATSAVLAFVGLPSSGTAAPHCPVHTVTLMSFSDGMTVAPVGLRPSGSATLVPTPATRSPGELALLWTDTHTHAHTHTGSATLVPTPVARPPGELAILGPRDGALWLLNSYAQARALVPRR
ncbi:hypothetical protein FOA52_012800 [Chlamydomonas sp. UWO 241]|nr:hypothetical protein FOA52_012800 [Chlamydomonas sp. UWO 241]